jgi:cell division topological specificity factor
MSWFSAFTKRKTASVARERLQILLTHDRGSGGQPDLIPVLREEVLAVVAKHFAIDPDKVQVKIERGKSVSLLEIDIEIPGLAGDRMPARRDQRDVPVEAMKMAATAAARKSAGPATRLATPKPA